MNNGEDRIVHDKEDDEPVIVNIQKAIFTRKKHFLLHHVIVIIHC